MSMSQEEAFGFILLQRVGSLLSQPKSIAVLFLSFLVVFNWVRHQFFPLSSHFFPLLFFCRAVLVSNAQNG